MHFSIPKTFVFVAILLSSLPVLAEDLYVSKVLTEPGGFTGGIEGPAVDASGNVYAVNYGKQSTIGAVAPDGSCSTFVTLPNGSVGNGIRFDGSETMFIADYVNHNVLKVDMTTKKISVLVHEPKMNQPNDLAIGRNDIIYCSDPNWGEKVGNIWRVTPDGEATLLDGKMGTTNGIEVSPDEKTLYVNESIQKNVWAYDLSSAGEISNKRVLIKFPDFGMDGMRCDARGNLHITRHGKGTIAIISPRGKLLREVQLKGKNPSNICFGGPDGRTCYVTLADRGNIESYRVEVPGRSWKLREARIETATAKSSSPLTFVQHVVGEGVHAMGADIGDRDARGKVDIIACTGSVVYLYSGEERHVIYEVDEGAGFIHVRTADIDRDGDVDAIVADYANGVRYLENPGKGAARKKPWTHRFVDPECIGPHAVALGDINRDGRIDVVASGEAKATPPDSIYWFECPAKPNEASRWPKHVLGPGQSGGLAHYPGIGDVNGDGRLDVVHAAKAPKTGEWYRLWTQPTDATRPWNFSVVGTGYTQATNVQVGDINGDGTADLLATQGHHVGVLWFEGPNWRPHSINQDLKSPHTLVLADLDRDGDLDGATCAYESAMLVWFENDGKGLFTTHVISKNQQAYDLVARDVDGDGDLDLVVAGQRSENVVWYEQSGRPN